jgi:hypothetical protein
MNYQKVYNDIVERGKVRDPEGYYEVHHIVPRCMGGGNEKENLTNLTAREHFIAHWLLARIYPNHRGVAFSFWAMSSMGKHKVSSRAYEEAKNFMNTWNSQTQKEIWANPEKRKNLSEISKKMWEDPEFLKTQKEKLKNSWTEEIKEKASKLKIQKYKDDPGYGKKIAENNKRNWSDVEYRKNTSKKISKTKSDLEWLKKNSKVSDENVSEIKKMLSEGITGQSIAKLFGLNKQMIYRIKHGRLYWWVE